MQYVGEHLLPGRLGHFFAILSFAASFVAVIAYFKATNAKTPEEESSWRRMGRIAFGIDVLPFDDPDAVQLELTAPTPSAA